MQSEQNSGDLLVFETTYERASTGKRFANYLIDIVVFYLFIIILGIIIGLFAPSLLDFYPDDDGGFGLLDRILSLIIYAAFMSVTEALLKGKSVGKFITRTRAVNLDGSQISTKTAFARGFSRAVPFCVFSALGTPCNPWQDSWTDTMVVNDTK